MKKYGGILVFLLLFVGGLITMAQAADDDNSSRMAELKQGLTLEIQGETPTNTYWDTETILPQKPIILSWRLDSALSEDTTVFVKWRLLDADGKKVLNGSRDYEVEAGQYMAGRQLFMPELRGSYLWVVEARVKLDGPDMNKLLAMPLVVVSAPPAFSDPFLSVETQPDPGDGLREFYYRVGGNVWRTSILDKDGNVHPPVSENAENIGVLSAPAEQNDTNWASQVEELLRDYSMRSWEIAIPDNNDVTDFANQSGVSDIVDALIVQSNRQPSIALPGLWKSPLPSEVAQFAGQFSLQLPAPERANSAARRRIIQTAKSTARDMGFGGFALHESKSTFSPAESSSPRESAAGLVQNAILAYSAGARSYSATLGSDLSSAGGAFASSIKFLSSSDSIDQLQPWERSAAFAATSHILGNAQFVKELFPDTPALYSSLFQSGNSTLAAVWSMQGNKGKMWLRLPGTTLLDAYGNEVDKANKKGVMAVPLTGIPYYVKAEVSPEIMERALRAGDMRGISPIQIQTLPLTQTAKVGTRPVIRVRLQNITPHTSSGTVFVDAPRGWNLTLPSQQFVLTPGQWEIYEFPVDSLLQDRDVRTRVRVNVVNGVRDKTSWNGDLTPAIAESIASQTALNVDGNLADWDSATWMRAKNSSNRRAQLAMRWDMQNLYIAAKVREPQIKTRDEGSEEYRFWESDSIQLGFGWRGGAQASPSGEPFRDTDYGVLLSPYSKTESGSIKGRVLSLWSPQTPFAQVQDRQDWGGTIDGAVCYVSYDAEKKETHYEAAIPLSALDGLDPQLRGDDTSVVDSPVHFGWIAHTSDGSAVQWGESNGVYPWWGNSGSFLPASKGYLAAQGLLGFENVSSPVNVAPSSRAGDDRGRNVPPADLPELPLDGGGASSLPLPVPVEPIPPDALPPAPQ